MKQKTSYLSSLRGQLHDRRTTRTARRDLERYVATYTSAAQISEMEAILARHDDSTEVIALRTVVQQARSAA